jgi:hypothetical protein
VNSLNFLSVVFISDFNELPVHQHFHPVASEVVEDGQMHGVVISSNYCLSVNSLVLLIKKSLSVKMTVEYGVIPQLAMGHGRRRIPRNDQRSAA